MLGKKYSLKNARTFNALKFKGQKKRVGPFLLSFLSDDSLEKHHCFGIIIPSRKIAKASARNKVKRKIRALLYKHKNYRKTNLGFLNLAILILAEPSQKDYQDLDLFLEKFFV